MVENKHYIITFETIIEAGDLFDAVKKGNRLAKEYDDLYIQGVREG